MSARDRTYEDAWLDQVLVAADTAGAPNPGFASVVRSRLQIGATRYGDAAFLTANVIEMGLEETPDVAAYAVLETHKRIRAAGSEVGQLVHLFQAGAHACISDWHFRQVSRLDRCG